MRAESKCEEYIVKLWYYYTVFTSEFNIGFEPSKGSTCNSCDKMSAEFDKLMVGCDDKKICDLNATKEVHLANAANGQRILKSFKPD